MNKEIVISAFTNISKTMLEITQSGIQTDEIIIKSDHIYTSGFVMNKTYNSGD